MLIPPLPSSVATRRGVGLTIAVLMLLSAAPAFGQATRTWVSGVGDDVNPCSRTAPCKTFAGAISKTAAGGEIDALDPGGFGAVTITKAMTIDGGGVLASILASGTNGVIVNAGANDRVVLRRLSINGAPGTGLNGVRFLAGKSLHVEDCVIANFSTLGIDVTAHGTLVVADSVVRSAAAGGIQIAPASGAAGVVIERTRVVDSGFGLHIQGSVEATVSETSATENTGAGFWVEGVPAELNLNAAIAARNQVGIHATDGGVVRTTGLTVTANTDNALLAEGGGVITPFSGNLITGNPPGAGTSTCEIGSGTATVNCVDATVDAIVDCPQPVCPAPVVEGHLGPCKRCRTRGNATTCFDCGVTME